MVKISHISRYSSFLIPELIKMNRLMSQQFLANQLVLFVYIDSNFVIIASPR